MTVTELAFFVGASGPVTAEGTEVINQAIEVQTEWSTHNAPSMPQGRENRGVSFLQQIEDPSVYLLTAHWASVEEHNLCIAAPENRETLSKIPPYFQVDKIVYFHLKDVAINSTSGKNGEISILQSPIISVGRLTIAAEKRQAFEQAWNEVKGILEEFVKPNVVKNGWRLEKENETTEEFVLVAGWPNLEKYRDFAQAKDFERYQSVLASFAQTRDLKCYRRIL